MAATLKHWDRRTVDTFRKLEGWIGYAEEHGIILDFGDRPQRVRPDGPPGPLSGRLGRVSLLADQLRCGDRRRCPAARPRSSVAAMTAPGR